MEDYMRDSMRKLALWYTRTFKPIATHDELEPVMATLGFVSVFVDSPNGGGFGMWKEYVYVAGGGGGQLGEVAAAPRPRLPCPRIDGLHIYTYQAFIDAVNFYLEWSDFSDIFHIRGMPLHRLQDRSRKWRRMEEEDSVFVYGDDALDPATQSLYDLKKQDNAKDGGIRSLAGHSSMSPIIRWKRSGGNGGSGAAGNSSSLLSSIERHHSMISLKMTLNFVD